MAPQLSPFICQTTVAVLGAEGLKEFNSGPDSQQALNKTLVDLMMNDLEMSGIGAGVHAATSHSSPTGNRAGGAAGILS